VEEKEEEKEGRKRKRRGMEAIEEGEVGRGRDA
jgi:hypothetical protein